MFTISNRFGSTPGLSKQRGAKQNGPQVANKSLEQSRKLVEQCGICTQQNKINLNDSEQIKVSIGDVNVKDPLNNL